MIRILKLLVISAILIITISGCFCEPQAEVVEEVTVEHCTVGELPERPEFIRPEVVRLEFNGSVYYVRDMNATNIEVTNWMGVQYYVYELEEKLKSLKSE